MARKRPPRQPAAGDIVVMKVASHFYVCRATAKGDRLAPLEVENALGDALARARELATGRQRVFLYGRAGSADFIEIHSGAFTHGDDPES